MRKMQLITDEKSGVSFEVYRPSKEEEHNTIFNTPVKCSQYDYKDIWSAYNNPSKYKTEIWHDWVDFFNSHDGYCFISSRSCFIFSISGYAEIIDSETGELLECNIWITKEHNRVYVINH